MTNSARPNNPDLWRGVFPRKKTDGHKYDSGLVQIFGAPKLTGATRLAAESCARAGAGLVCVLAPKGTGDIYRSSLPAHILVYDSDFWKERVSARLYGPGGLAVKPDYKSKIPTVLDAEALYDLPKTLGDNFILTPHEGEFAYAFPEIQGAKVEKAMAAAKQTGAIMVLKGPETVIAHPDGRAALNTNAPPTLATAGSGDVLAGIVAGLAAQGMPPFESACAAVWIHGEAAKRFGPGLVAADLPDLIPGVLRDLS